MTEKKLQAPSSNIQRNAKHQTSILRPTTHGVVWSLDVEASLELGAWMLALSQLIPFLQHLPQPPGPAREQRLRRKVETDFPGTPVQQRHFGIRLQTGVNFE